MKKFRSDYFVFALLVVACAFVCITRGIANAAHPTAATYNVNYAWELDTTISSSTARDTIASTTDSLVVFNKRSMAPGYEYFFVCDAPTGTNAANTEWCINVYAQDLYGKTLYGTTSIDSVVGAAGNAWDLEIGKTIIGSQYRFVLKAGGANGAQTILNRAYIYKRKSIIRDEVGRR